ILEYRLDASNGIAETHRPPAFGHRCPQRFKVIRSKIVNKPGLAESSDEEIGRVSVFTEHAQAQLAGLALAELRREEAVAKIGNGQAVALYAWGASCVQVIGNFLVLFQGFLPAVSLNADEFTVDAVG